ncbi:glycine oxidase ThiO [Virgibacillus xinjiangensis]|uniref:glycine oxidase n=1 Tax=Virgibacillus xinjiangensis TaxID=393090 RepID=A0ABV7CWK7_9BACI
MNKQYDSIVVGAGVIGCSIAFQLSKRGHRVLVVEKNEVGQKASSAAAGMLGAQNEIKDDSPLLAMAQKSRAMFPELAEELKDLSHMDIELIQSGILRVAHTEKEMAELEAAAAFQQAKGETAEFLNAAEVKEKEPEISSTALGGLYMPDDGQISPPLLCQALARSAAVLGAEFREHTEVTGLVKNHGSVSGIQTAMDTFHADSVIVAGGAWSRQIIEKTGLSLDAYPVKGECFSVRYDHPLVTSSIFSSSGYIVPKAGGRLIIGATENPGTFDESVQLESLHQMMHSAMEILPKLKDAKWEKAWAGIRPQTGDGLPYLGEHPSINGLFTATGHYRNGMLLAPITGVVMADQIEGKQTDDRFRIDRLPYKEVRI